jgi:fluoride exporter
MWHALLVFVGGGMGCLARYGVGIGVIRLWPPKLDAQPPHAPHLPLAATLGVNLLGCLLIGLAWGRMGVTMRDETRLLLVTGFLGGFTTFSAIGWESFSLINRGQHALAGGYIAATLVLGLIFVWIGHRVGVTMSSP